jgi:hypothetical protein
MRGRHCCDAARQLPRRSGAHYLLPAAAIFSGRGMQDCHKKRTMIMTTRSGTYELDGALATEKPDREGFFHRAFRRLIESREAQGRRIVDQHLSTLSEEQLLELGFESADVRRIRASANAPVAFWI